MSEQPQQDDQEVVVVSPAIVEQISTQLGDNVSSEQVQSVLSAWHTMRSGAAVGTVLHDPVRKAVAHRVEEAGVQVWRCSSVDGSQWSDMQPTLPWDVLFDPGAVDGVV